MKSLADMIAQIGKESEENRRTTMMKKDRRPVREGRIKTEADTVKFLVKLKSASDALLDLSAAWNDLKDEEVLSEVDRYYELALPDEHSFISRPRKSFDEFAYDFLSFTQPVLDKFVRGSSLDEATAPEFERLGGVKMNDNELYEWYKMERSDLWDKKRLNKTEWAKLLYIESWIESYISKEGSLRERHGDTGFLKSERRDVRAGGPRKRRS